MVVLDGGGEGQDIGKDGILGGRLRCGEGVEGRVGFGEAVEVVRGIGEVRDDGRVDIQIEWQGGRARADVKGLVHVPWSGWSNCTVVRNALLIIGQPDQIRSLTYRFWFLNFQHQRCMVEYVVNLVVYALPIKAQFGKIDGHATVTATSPRFVNRKNVSIKEPPTNQ